MTIREADFVRDFDGSSFRVFDTEMVCNIYVLRTTWANGDQYTFARYDRNSETGYAKVERAYLSNDTYYKLRHAAINDSAPRPSSYGHVGEPRIPTRDDRLRDRQIAAHFRNARN